MPKPANKTQLLSESQEEYEALEQFLAGIDQTQMNQPGALGDWSVKDTLAHLYEWQQMFMRWYTAGLRGENPPTPAEGYKWSQLPALNQMIYEKYTGQPLEVILTQFRISHQQTMQLIQSLPDADLFTPGLYTWMRTSVLAAYLSANTGSHYRWARTEMRKRFKQHHK